ncbi:concanavalin A-like lectin protein kinase family protein [Striga asiatica]|uniref:Concanavalin A-like lectin protein kinase family protein n=1 Tax=Striga asiatica TaxID=4170 RepID=A0A5A7P4P6_STRAF|nr:concanavalin A-like lectin protein kinase family protein [Striga asiatica]
MISVSVYLQYISPSSDLLSGWEYLGLFNSTTVGNASNHVFAIELDTVPNFEFNDVNNNHVGLTIGLTVSAFLFLLTLISIFLLRRQILEGLMAPTRDKISGDGTKSAIE